MENLLFFAAGALTLAVCLFFFYQNKRVKKYRAEHEIKNADDRKRIEADLKAHFDEIERIMANINKYKNVLLFMLPIPAMAQPMAIPKLQYKDVISISTKGLIYNYADTAIVISPERYRFYEGLIQDITLLNAHYEAVVAGKDSIIDLTIAQLRESDDLLNECGTKLEAERSKKPGAIKVIGQCVAAAIVGLGGIVLGSKFF